MQQHGLLGRKDNAKFRTTTPPFPSPSPSPSILFPFGPAATINPTNHLSHWGQGSIRNAHSLGHTASHGRPKAGRGTTESFCAFLLPDCKMNEAKVTLHPGKEQREARENPTFNTPRDVLISLSVRACVCVWAREFEDGESVSHMWWVYYRQPSRCRGPAGVWDVPGIQTKQKTPQMRMERGGNAEKADPVRQK